LSEITKSRHGRVKPGHGETLSTHSRLDDENSARSHEEGWLGAFRKLGRYCAGQ
jgi:hypothetical protein